MVTVFYGLTILLSIGVLGYFLANYLNKDIRNIKLKAEKHVCGRLLERQSVVLDFKELNLSEEKAEKAIKILTDIANIIGVMDIKLFRFNESLKDILRVEFNELDDISLNAWNKAGLENHIEVYSYEIMNYINKIVNKNNSEKILKEISCSNDNTEDEIIDALFSLKLSVFLKIIVG